MNERLAAAQAALRAGRGAEAIEPLMALIEAEPNQPVPLYRALLVQLYRANRLEEGAAWGEAGIKRHPRDVELLNVLGVVYRRLSRHSEALARLDQAAKLSPNNTAVQSNRGNVLLDLDDGPRAEAVFTKLVRAEPRNADYLRQLGRALVSQGKRDAAASRFRQAVALQKTLVEAWLDLIGLENAAQKAPEAEALLERALAANPEHPRLLEARAVILRRLHELRRAEAYLIDLLPRFEDAAWLHYQLGVTIADYDRERANIHLRRAVALDPGKLDYLIALIESLERTRTGDEGANIEEAYQLALRALTFRTTRPGQVKVLNEVLIRVCAFDDLARLGDFKSRGRGWASAGIHGALLKQLAQVRTLEDRYELLEQHRIWGRRVEAEAAKHQLRRPPPRAKDGKIRLGFLSSDLRAHPVGYFALPLFEHVDPDRFEIYCYSFYQGEHADRMQAFFASKSTAFRWTPDISTPDAAQVIADDQLDMLIELGGSTHMNRLEVMAYRAAPLQASWLGYPHSAGLSTIDYLILDPYILPDRRELLIEQPLVLKHAWYPLTPQIFRDKIPLTPEPPAAANGFVTFGTANNPQKYTAEVLRTWAQIMQACPGSRFLFIRPEGGASSFRQNILDAFAQEGIQAERIQFEAVRGAHLPHYNRIDISLDPFPQTGGTTTCESLWMGAPCVTLAGEAPFERLSYSVLANLELLDLSANTVPEYLEIAARLAHDGGRLAALRSGMRARMRASPLGRTDAWARDFYDLIARTVEVGGALKT